MTDAPTPAEIEARLAFAATIAGEAGSRLFELRASGRWTDEATLGDIGDQAADGFLQGYLRGRHPEDGILSEETVDSPERHSRRWTWIIDPLDGTNEFRTQRHDWAVHVGLCRDGRPLLGAVALPAIGRVLAGVVGDTMRAAVAGHGGDWPTALAPADAGGGAEDGPLRIAVSRSHTPSLVQRFADAWGPHELIPCGSVGFKVALLLFGKADAYVHKKGLKEWDTCAPEAIATAAGFCVSRLDGSAHRYNRTDPRNDEILVCRPAHKERILACLRPLL
ncbi:MAG: 3'(2'),5'-bisphosphate nucleotidase CysQ [Planctomycetota bacterium]